MHKAKMTILVLILLLMAFATTATSSSCEEEQTEPTPTPTKAGHEYKFRDEVVSINGQIVLVHHVRNLGKDRYVQALNPFPDLAVGDHVKLKDQGGLFDVEWIIIKVEKKVEGGQK